MQIQEVREVAEEFQSEHPEIAQDTLPIFGLFWSRIGQRLMSRNERRRVNLQGFDRSGCLFCSIRRQLHTSARISLPALNFTIARAGIDTSISGFLGLRPLRVLAILTLKTPKLRNSTLSPFARTSEMWSRVFCTKTWA